MSKKPRMPKEPMGPYTVKLAINDSRTLKKLLFGDGDVTLEFKKLRHSGFHDQVPEGNRERGSVQSRHCGIPEYPGARHQELPRGGLR